MSSPFAGVLFLKNPVKGESVIRKVKMGIGGTEVTRNMIICKLVSTKYEYENTCKSDVWLTVHRNSVWIRKTN